MAGFNPATWPTFNQNPLTQSLASAQAFNHNNLTNQGLRFNNDHANEMLALKEFIAKNSARNAKNAEDNIALQHEKLLPQQVNAIARASQIPGFSELQAKDPELARQVLQGLAGYSNKFNQTQNNPAPSVGGGVGQYLVPGGAPAPNFPALQNYSANQGQPPQPQMMQAQAPPQQPAQSQPMPSQMMQQQNTAGQPMQSPMTPSQMPPNSGGVVRVSPQEVASAQTATASNLEQKNRTSQQINQATYNKTFDGLFQDIKKVLPDIAKYSGPLGRARLEEDRAKSVRTGKMPDSYRNYVQYMNVLRPSLAKEYSKATSGGGKATEAERAQDLKLMPSPEFFGTPQAFLSKVDAISKAISSVSKSASMPTSELIKALPDTKSPTSSGLPPLSGRPKVGTSSIPTQSKNTNAVFVDSVPPGHIAMIDKKGQPRVILSDHEKDAMALGWRRKYG